MTLKRKKLAPQARMQFPQPSAACTSQQRRAATGVPQGERPGPQASPLSTALEAQTSSRFLTLLPASRHRFCLIRIAPILFCRAFPLN